MKSHVISSMEEKLPPRRRRVWKWVLGIFLSLVLLLGIGGYIAKQYLQKRWKPLLSEQLKKLVVNASDSLYRIEYSDFDLNMISGNVMVKDFRLVPDTNVYRQLLGVKKAPDNLYDLSVKKLELRKLLTKEAIRDKKLSIRSIIIDEPALMITNRRQAYNDTVKLGKPKTPYQLISKIFRELRIDSVLFNNIDFTYVNKSNAKPKSTSLHKLNIVISDIFIDSLSAQDESRFYYTKNVQVRLKDYRMATPDSLYHIKAGEFFFSTAQRTLRLSDVAMEPRLNKVRFYKTVGYAKDRFDIAFKAISFNRLDLQQFLREQKVHAGFVELAKGKLDVYNNSSYPKHSSVKVHAYPHQKLQEVSLDLMVDTLSLNGIDISYSEYNPATRQTGTISFDKTRGRLFNVTNEDDAKKKNGIMRASIDTRLMNSGPLHVNFRFDLNDKDGAFSYSGQLGQTNGRVLNKITRPLGMIEVESANIRKLNFSISANEHTARGDVKFYYDHLQVSLLKRDGTELAKQSFVSRVANAVLPSANPDSKGNFLSGPVSYRREPTASFFNFLWKAIFDGLKPSVGFTKEREQKLNNTVEKVGDVVTGFGEAKSSLTDALRERREARRKQREARKAEKEAARKKAEEEKTD
ncbi:MAG: hypothetical protein INR69_09425 [Mucilaginibacter polytrichastri]|nr:hypothetical protein [Mucilaginibacter polytrichastri]